MTSVKETVFVAAKGFGCSEDRLARVWEIVSKWDLPDDEDVFLSDVEYATRMANSE